MQDFIWVAQICLKTVYHKLSMTWHILKKRKTIHTIQRDILEQIVGIMLCTR